MRHPSRILIAMLCAVFFMLLSPIPSFSQNDLRTLDLKSLAEQAGQLAKRLDKDPSDYAALCELGKARYYMAVQDAKSYLKEAIQSLERALKAKPDDNEVLCYLGSAYLMLVRDESNPIDLISYLNKGLEYMDSAVKGSPHNINIRMIRGYTTKAMPVFLNRRPTAYEDFEYIATLIEKGTKVPPSVKSIVYLTLASMYREDGDSEKAGKCQTLAEKTGE
jgi:tetratricopeptide (TPR) repeat protein